MASTEFWETMSAIVGWLYFFAWSLSFYPQAIENYQRKSVAGFSIEFAVMNPSGFYFYSFYSVAGSVDQYLGTGYVAPNDLVFALHAFALSSVQLVQIFMYERGQQGDIKIWVIVLLVCEYLVIFAVFIVEITGHPLNDHWDTVLVCGYAKALITFVKYLPQVYLNYKRKSTVGWSLANVLLDFTGGTLSFVQQMIESWALHESLFKGEAFNVVKFILSICSILFDSIFLIQHYILYPHARKAAKEEEKTEMMQKLADGQENSNDTVEPQNLNPSYTASDGGMANSGKLD